MTNHMRVGFSQRVRLEWLEYTANLVSIGRSRREIENALEEFLRDRLSVGRATPRHGSREKTTTILLRIWVSPPAHIIGLRDEGLELLTKLPENQHLAVHWGMTIAVYPFVSVVAECVGRLLRLQDVVSQAQVQQRLREQLGQRETVARAVRRVIRCFVDWGVLEDTSRKGVYRAARAQEVENGRLCAWLIEAALVASGSNVRPLSQLLSSPALFPFELVSPLCAAEGSNRLSVLKQGLHDDVVMLLYNQTT